MKAVNLKVGAKGERKPVEVPVQVAENLEDVQKLSRGSLPVVLRCFNRGWRIENQERSGARDAFREGKTQDEIATLVNGYDPTVVVPRTRGPQQPKTVVLPKGKKSFTPEELAALLSGAGIKANLVTEGAQPAPAAAPAK